MKYKFRVWSVGKMYIVAEFDCARDIPFWFKPLIGYDEVMIPHLGAAINRKVDPDFIIMQYSGFNDKDGKNIYDQDIIQLFIGGISDELFEYKIQFENGKFEVYHYNHPKIGRWGDISRFGEIENFSIKVIGNVYENRRVYI